MMKKEAEVRQKYTSPNGVIYIRVRSKHLNYLDLLKYITDFILHVTYGIYNGIIESINWNECCIGGI
jgi:hypothetical protein